MLHRVMEQHCSYIPDADRRAPVFAGERPAGDRAGERADIDDLKRRMKANQHQSSTTSANIDISYSDSFRGQMTEW
jgi:hypothetical protein